MTQHPGWAVLVDYLLAIATPAKRAVLNGGMADFDKYNRVTGELIGLHKAIDGPAVLAEMVEKARDRMEEEQT